jgi:hypothetical protein
MRTITALTFVCTLTLVALPSVGTAQSLDCKKPIQRAQAAIEKVTDDMQGMETMPKDQLDDIHRLLDDAKKNLDSARQSCGKPGVSDQARAIGEAEAAHGYAVAADRLHFHFMKDMTGMAGTKSGDRKHGDMKGMATTKDSTGATKNMGGMK